MFLNLVLGGFTGFLTGKVMRDKGYVIISDILLGLAGRRFAAWVLGIFGVYVPSWNYLVITVIGAVFLITLVRVVMFEN